MSDSVSKDIQLKEKQEVATQAEQTTPGIVFTPAVDIFETENALTLVVDMPGVDGNDLDIDLRDDILTLTGAVAPYEETGEEEILVEYEVGKYYRQFTLPEVIDQKKIDAQLKDGVLRLSLPKVEKAMPKKIEVKTN